MFGGIVVHGDGKGKDLGYPTANLNISPVKTKCKDGIYAAKAIIQKKEYKGALVIDSPRKKVEIYLFDYSGKDFYGLYMDVEPIQKVSELESHDSFESLKEKIGKDIQLIKEVLFA
jgi:riboflavin kinase/FMN adenylyltransferase